jgi:hypothetical protein
MFVELTSFALIKYAIDSIMISDIQSIIKRFYLNTYIKIIRSIVSGSRVVLNIIIRDIRSYNQWKCNNCTNQFYKNTDYMIEINNNFRYCHDNKNVWHYCWDLSRFLNNVGCNKDKLIQCLYDLRWIFSSLDHYICFSFHV